MTITEILKNVVYIPDTMMLVETEYDNQYSIVELETENGVPFKMFYYIVNQETHQVYYGGYDVPVGVNIERVIRGQETPLKRL